MRRIRNPSGSGKAVKVSYSGAQPWWCRVWWPLITCQPRAARQFGARKESAGSGSAWRSQIVRSSKPAISRRQLLQPGTLPGLYVQAYVPYGSSSKTAALPIPATLQPNYSGTASNISYPDVATSDLFSLAGGATTYFGLRFTGGSAVSSGGDSTQGLTHHASHSASRLADSARVRDHMCDQTTDVSIAQCRPLRGGQCSGSSDAAAVASCMSMLVAICCAGNITVPANVSTNYTFSMDSDDGAQLYIDKTLLVDKLGALGWPRRSPVPGWHACPSPTQSISLRSQLPTPAHFWLLGLHARARLRRSCATTH